MKKEEKENSNPICEKCGNLKDMHPMAISDGLGHVERCEFEK